MSDRKTMFQNKKKDAKAAPAAEVHEKAKAEASAPRQPGEPPPPEMKSIPLRPMSFPLTPLSLGTLPSRTLFSTTSTKDAARRK